MKKGNPFSFVEIDQLGVWHSTNSTLELGYIVYSWIHAWFFKLFSARKDHGSNITLCLLDIHVVTMLGVVCIGSLWVSNHHGLFF